MIGIIGGSGVYELTQKADSCTEKIVKTDYGEVKVSILDICSKKVAFLPRHASMNEEMPPGSFVIPDDFLDFSQDRAKTFYEDKVVHIDVTEPYCPNLRDVLAKSGNVILGGTYVCTEGPRFETPAEIKMFKMLGGDLVGMTGVPEVTLAREREICYNSICIVSNFASGISEEELTIDEVFEMMAEKKDELLELIYNFIQNVDDGSDCMCNHALDGAEV